MNDFRLFLGKFLSQGTSIASVAPSSRWLSQTTVRNIDWAKARALVELGAGTASFLPLRTWQEAQKEGTDPLLGLLAAMLMLPRFYKRMRGG